ncbi:PLP-dependent aminotransferase family protein [Bordetella avium]|uniref:GntR-family transcriptional regulator n=1 Tax=Bordetella avium (strain 197N) TaxID=360910 RepID=Q2L0R7_BORA1|nr:PLP-dependent aminotransferase family protein [Bordetella avium]AZY52547.1 PLP-dependent aminotransferase family protein [Bordetella avium]RIQ48598.1 PLP-dependent aminotransferase family protein [Bordetella avium]CAJ49446.1 GntR-family transcriptional regulator [Bordetella avium 197N]
MSRKKGNVAELSWLKPLSPGRGPRYQQIAQQVIDAAREQRLLPGDRLPPQRELAQQLGVDLTTVTRAYNALRASGLLAVHGARGTYIALPAEISGDAGSTVDLSMNIPPLTGSVAFGRALQLAAAHAQARLSKDALMSYHVGPGAALDREAGALWLRPVLGRIERARVIVCSGAQTALAGLMLARSREGDGVLTDTLTYPGLLAAASTLRREICPVPGDEQGMLPQALEQACVARRPALLYLNPTIHNPTTITMSAPRRAEIYDIASRHGVAIIEDDPYYLLAGDAPAPFASYQGGAPVFYVSTLSKTLAPGLRTAYIVTPAGEPQAPLLDALRSITLMPSAWMTALATQMIESGAAQRWLGEVRAELERRQTLAAGILPTASLAHPGGLHRWLTLPPGWDEHRLIRAAQDQGLGVTPSAAFSALDRVPHAVRISLGGAADLAALEIGLRRLAGILADPGLPRVSGVV